MHVGNHNPYSIDGQVLNEVTEHKDLGVVFDHVLKFIHTCLQQFQRQIEL